MFFAPSFSGIPLVETAALAPPMMLPRPVTMRVAEPALRPPLKGGIPIAPAPIPPDPSSPPTFPCAFVMLTCITDVEKVVAAGETSGPGDASTSDAPVDHVAADVDVDDAADVEAPGEKHVSITEAEGEEADDAESGLDNEAEGLISEAPDGAGEALAVDVDVDVEVDVDALAACWREEGRTRPAPLRTAGGSTPVNSRPADLASFCAISIVPTRA